MRSSPRAEMAVSQSRQASGAVGFIAIYLAYRNGVCHRVEAQYMFSISEQKKYLRSVCCPKCVRHRSRVILSQNGHKTSENNLIDGGPGKCSGGHRWGH